MMLRLRTSAWISLCALLLSVAHPGTPDALSTARKRVEQLANAGAKEGLADAARACLAQLPALGAKEKDLDKLEARIEKALSKAKRAPKPRTLEKLRDNATAAAEAVALAASEADSGEDLLRVALALDGDLAAANEALGNVRTEEGRWCTPEAADLLARRLEIGAALQRARAHEVQIEHVEPVDTSLLEVFGEEASACVYRGLRVESTMTPARLEEMLRASVRAMAFGRWLLDGRLDASVAPGVAVILPDQVSYGCYVDAALSAGRIDDAQHRQYSQMGGCWIPASPGSGFSGDALAHRASTGEIGGILIHYYDHALRQPNEDGEFGDTITPHWVKSGHNNYISLSVLGGTIPGVVLKGADDRTRSTGSTLDLRIPNAGLIGCRSWLRDLARKNRAPSLARCVVDQGGKISGDLLLRATASIEYLHERGEMGDLAKRRKKVWGRQPEGTGTLVERTEGVLGRSIAEFDAEWTRWILGESEGSSVRDLIVAASTTEDQVAVDMLASLNELRASAGLDAVTLDRDLSRGAELHARYLELHPEQKSAWPAAHEQYPEAEGFTPAGAWAGAHGVIAFNGAGDAIDEWMGTFYHRVPLTHPGLLRIGVGVAEETSVLDCTSLRDPTGAYESHYPHDGQRGVPLRFVPELPNPVPEREDQHTLGFPITYQLGPNWSGAVQLRLLRGDEEVQCFFSTPTSPTNPRLAPDGCYCLIPEAPLEARTKYRVVVEGPGQTTDFEFETGR